MPYCWPDDTVFTRLELHVEDRRCHTCGGQLTVCDHRHRRLFTLTGPLHVVCKLAHCPDRTCPAHTQTHSPEAETALAMPWCGSWGGTWCVGWAIGVSPATGRWGRSARNWPIPTRFPSLDDAIECYIHRYQQMVAARQQDPHRLAAAYAEVAAVMRSIDGLQPEKGHETLYVVRELPRKRVWFAEALVSSTTAEVQRLLAQAREWAARLGKPVRLWMSDTHAAFVRGIAAEFPEVPHRYCANHFLRDVAKPVLAADSHAKVQMRRKVRGLRSIAREVYAAQRPAEPAAPEPEAGATAPVAVVHADEPPPDVVLDYCAAVRGILNEDHGGPLHPPGLRMAEALGEVQTSLQRNLAAQKGGPLTSNWGG